MPIGAREAQFGRELAAYGIAQQEADRPAALLVQRDIERARDGVLATVLVAGEEDGEALLEARGVGFAQNADDFRVGEPFGDVLTRA